MNETSQSGGSLSVSLQQHLRSLRTSVHKRSINPSYSYFIACRSYFVAPSIFILISCAQIRMPTWWKWFLYDFITFGLFPGLVVITFVAYLAVELTPRSVYLVDFACSRPPKELKHALPTHCRDSGLENITLKKGREEAALAMYAAVDELFAGIRIRPKDIDMLVLNCGVLNPTPSLSAMLVNHYKLRHDILSYNLGGMGCAAGGIAVDLAKDLLCVHPGSCALVVSTEIVGHSLDMLGSSRTFRMGAAAILLSNHRLDRWHSKYELKQTVRTHKGMDDRSFNCARLEEDEEGKQGLYLSNDSLDVAVDAIKDNVARLCAARDHKHCFEHVCILAPSMVALDELRSKLELTDEQMEASRRTLERFGDTSSSGVWYELAHLEAWGRMKKGDRVWQLAFGSGFKCTSTVWEALRSIERPTRSPWLDGATTN